MEKEVDIWETIQNLQRFAEIVTTDYEEIKIRGSASALANRYKRLYEIEEEIDKIMKVIGLVMNHMKTTSIPAAFETEELKSFTTNDGKRITVTNRVFASISKNYKEEAYEWLRKNKLGDLIYETVNSQSLSSAAKSIMSEGREMPEDLFNVAILNNVSVTKS